MAECYRCHYTHKVERRFGHTVHCNLEPTEMDVTYYCDGLHNDETNLLCPFVNPCSRFQGVDYGKYETDILKLKGE